MNARGARAIEGILLDGTPPGPIDDEISATTGADLSTAADYWQSYVARREQLYDRVLRASGEEHLETKIYHRQFGALNWREWLLFMRVHDLDHMRQLQAIAWKFGDEPAGIERRVVRE